MVHCGASGGQDAYERGSNQTQMKPCQELSLTSQISDEREDQVLPIPSLNAVDVGSESLSATLCLTKAFSEYLVEPFWRSLKHLNTTW